jgi:hypothetical protein
MKEYCSTYGLEGRTWAITELPNRLTTMAQNDKQFPNFYMNELAAQFEFEQRKILLLTNGGCYF